MVAPDLCPVVDELNLLFAFSERAVATSYTQTIAETGNHQSLSAIGRRTAKPTDIVPTELERPKSRRLRVSGVRESGATIVSTDAKIIHRSAAVGFCSLRIIFEPAEAEIRQQRAAERLREAGC